MMRNLIGLMVIIASVIMPGFAYDIKFNTQEDIFNAGYHMAYLAIDGQDNKTAENEYNVHVNELNIYFRSINSSMQLDYLRHTIDSYVLPEVLRDDYKPWEHTSNPAVNGNAHNEKLGTGETIKVGSSYDLSEQQMQRAVVKLGEENYLGWV